MFQGLKQDIHAIRERDPAARSSVEVLLLYSGLHALMHYRLSHWCYSRRMFFLARMISQWAKFLTGTEIHPGAKIGRGVLIDHGSGIVIGETAEVGDGCTLYQGVTLGGTGKDKGKRHPTLGKNVLVGCGAKILGPFTVGDGAKIAANAVVLAPVPENATAVGVPARVVRVGSKRVTSVAPGSDMDQVHLPDPVSQELCKLLLRIEHLEKRLAEFEGTQTAGRADEPAAPEPAHE